MRREFPKIYMMSVTLNNHYYLRMLLQKVEFFICWTFFIANILAVTTQTEEATAVTILAYTLCYLQISVLSRAVAYAFDFSRALVKINNIPEWLKLHHVGCLFIHSTMVYLILGLKLCADLFNHTTAHLDLDFLRVRLLVLLMADQASHNTWTKAHSKILYWFNAFGIGLTCSALSFLLSSSWVRKSATGQHPNSQTIDIQSDSFLWNTTGASRIGQEEDSTDFIEVIATIGYALAVLMTGRGMLKLVASETSPGPQ